MTTGRSAALPASSASLSVPLTQNTAPVIKFQCLFTHDLRRKAKRWQDGFLRFHTFNKRIMVYELSGNFIGDLHWQTDAELQDGDEFQLEQGAVLVQVGECLERTHADLTPLLEKRKKTTTSTTTTTMRTPIASPPRPPNPLPSAESSSSGSVVRYPADRLKPLSEVLGMRQGPSGRAALPEKSPYEWRYESHDNNNVNMDRQHSKRQKRNRDHDEGDGSTGHEQSTVTIEESRRPTSRGIPQGITSSTTTALTHPSKPDLSGGVPSFQPASTVKVSDNTKGSSRSRRKSPDKECSRRQQQRSIADSFSVDNSANSPQFPPKKPRNKLVCRELLSASSSNKTQKQPKDRLGVHKPPDRVNSSNAKPEPRSERDDGLSNVTKSSILTPTDGNNTLAFIPSVSTLQALEEAEAPASSQRDGMISDFFKPSGSKSRQNNPGNEVATDENLDPQSTAIPHPPRGLIRSHSDIPSDATASTTTALANGVPLLPAEANSRQQQRSLQKSHSDVSSLRANGSSGGSHASRAFQSKLGPMITMANDNLSAALDGDDNSERGPWTSEALDLFDWWPPGRPKPMLGATVTGARAS